MNRHDLTDEYRDETGKYTMVSDDVKEPHHTIDYVDWLEAKILDKANGNNMEQDKCHIQRVNRWAYLYDNWSAIMLGFGVAISFSILLNMIENIVVKIALIIHGG